MGVCARVQARAHARVSGCVRPCAFHYIASACLEVVGKLLRTGRHQFRNNEERALAKKNCVMSAGKCKERAYMIVAVAEIK